MAGNEVSDIQELEPGRASFIRERINHGPWEISWVVKETDAVLRKLGTPRIEFRSALFSIRGVGRIPVLVRVNDRICEMWVDHHADPKILPTLTTQERVLSCSLSF
jgi:hypothetical protein